MKRWRFISIIGLAILVAGCVADGFRRDDRRDDRSGDRRGEQAWELLGEKQADFRVDHDRIDVGRREGRFSAMRIEVRGAPLEMRDMVVTFTDGSKFSPNMRARFEENTRTREIDLPGDRRAIRSVDFTYRSIDRREGRATVMLYAR